MKWLKQKWIRLIVLFFALAIVFKCMSLCFDHRAASVGIIGGADGPTVIYLGTSWGHLIKDPAIYILVLGLIYAVYRWNQKKRKSA